MNKSKRNAYVAVLCSLAVVINIIENIFIPPLAFGIRFGLANIVSIVALKVFGEKQMALVVLTRLTLGNLIKGTIFGTSFWISSMGIILSSICLLFLHKQKASIIFTSMMSSLFHSLGQLIVVTIIYGQVNIILLLPILIISSLASGTLTGLIAKEVINRIRI